MGREDDAEGASVVVVCVSMAFLMALDLAVLTDRDGVVLCRLRLFVAIVVEVEVTLVGTAGEDVGCSTGACRTLTVGSCVGIDVDDAMLVGPAVALGTLIDASLSHSYADVGGVVGVDESGGDGSDCWDDVGGGALSTIWWRFGWSSWLRCP